MISFRQKLLGNLSEIVKHLMLTWRVWRVVFEKKLFFTNANSGNINCDRLF